MKNNLIWIFSCFIIISLSGCSKDDDQPLRQTILVPDKIIMQRTGGKFEEYTFTYNEINKIASIIGTLNYDGTTTNTLVEMTYNPDGRINEMIIYNDGADPYIHTFTYSPPYILLTTPYESISILEKNGNLEFEDSFGTSEKYVFDNDGQLYSVIRSCTQLLTTTDAINGPFKNVEMDKVFYPFLFSKSYYGFNKKGVIKTNNLFCHGLDVDVILQLNSENYVQTTTSVYPYTTGDVTEVFNYTYKKI